MKTRTRFIEKFLDHYIGSLILLIIGLFYRKKTKPTEIKKIGLLKENALGDTVLLSAIIKDVKKHYQNCEVVLVTGKQNAILNKNLEFCDRFITIPIKNPLQSIKILKKENFDLFYDFGSWPRINALITFFSSSKYTVGFKTPGQHRHFCYDQSVLHKNNCHELINYQTLIKEEGLTTNSLPNLIVTDDLIEELKSTSYVIFHLWASGTNYQLREWSFENWKSLGKYCDDKNFKVVLTGSKQDFEKSEDFKEEYLPKAINLAGKTTISQTITILAKCNALISVNTGIMHMGAAVGAKTIGLSGPTNSKRWGPLGENSVSITPDCEGCEYLNLGFEYQRQRKDCMEHISYEKVEKALEKFLEH